MLDLLSVICNLNNYLRSKYDFSFFFTYLHIKKLDEIQKELKFVRSPINLKKKKIKKSSASLYKKIDTNHTKKLKVGENRRSIAIKEAVHIEAQSSSVINVDRSNRGMTNNFTLPRICSDFIGYRCVDDCLHDIIIFITFHAVTRTKDIIKTINLRAIFIKCIPKCSPPISVSSYLYTRSLHTRICASRYVSKSFLDTFIRTFVVYR